MLLSGGPPSCDKNAIFSLGDGHRWLHLAPSDASLGGGASAHVFDVVPHCSPEPPATALPAAVVTATHSCRRPNYAQLPPPQLHRASLGRRQRRACNGSRRR
ncbi:unnamed protein product, partial [Phaeothamnion confervicola]